MFDNQINIVQWIKLIQNSWTLHCMVWIVCWQVVIFNIVIQHMKTRWILGHIFPYMNQVFICCWIMYLMRYNHIVNIINYFFKNFWMLQCPYPSGALICLKEMLRFLRIYVFLNQIVSLFIYIENKTFWKTRSIIYRTNNL